MARPRKNSGDDIETATGSNVPAIDFDSLEPTIAEPEALKRVQGSKYANSPANKWLAESFRTGKAMQVTVLTSQVPTLKQTIRACAALLHIGHRFGDDKTVGDKTTVTFAGVAPKKTKRQLEREAQSNAETSD